MKGKSKQSQIEEAFFLAEKLALEEVERMARKILIKHKNLDEFVMCMGGWFFTRKEGTKTEDGQIAVEPEKGYNGGYNSIIISEPLKYMSRLRDFIAKWDEYLHLTGTPMRFTATGEKITDW